MKRADRLLVELEGARQLDQPAQSLTVAAMLLSLPRLSPKQFYATLEAILTFEGNLRKWRKPVERTFSSLSRSGQSYCSSAMFDFYFLSHSMRKSYLIFKEFHPFPMPTIIDLVKELAEEEGLTELSADLAPYLFQARD